MNWHDTLIELLPSLKRYAFLLSRNTQDGEDVVQDSLVRMLRSEHTYDKSKPIIPWALRIVRNQYFDHRKQTPEHESLTEDTSDNTVANIHTPAFLDKEMAETIAAIHRLSAPYREILILIAFEGLSYKEAAELLDIPIGTIMSRLARARKSLIAQLGDKIETDTQVTGEAQ